MADCDRNVVQIFDAPDLRRAPLPFGYESILSTRRARSPTQRMLGGEGDDDDDREGQESSEAPTPNAGDYSRSRSSTPHLPATTHYANFQTLQQLSINSNNTRLSIPSEGGSESELSPLSLSASALSFGHHNNNRMDRSIDSSNFPSTTSSRRNSISASTPNLTSSILQLASTDTNNHNNNNSTSPNRSSSIKTTTTLGASSSQHLKSTSSNLTNTTVINPTSAYVSKLQSDLVLLKGECDFQTYLKGLHLAHMGTLHREKVLESGAEAERQSLVSSFPSSFLRFPLTRNGTDESLHCSIELSEL